MSAELDNVLDDSIYQDYAADMDAMQAVFEKEFRREERRNKRIFAALLSLMPKRRLTAMKAEFADIGARAFSFVRETGRAKKQRSEIPGVKFEWIHQIVNGGYEGDTFEGHAYYQVKENPPRFLKLWYSC